ncbi:SPOR domain-containing protein [Clostridium tarantellae]|uniref:SPOR domain-containing protein n=1 Tax=Clostridium tarantellae TaxID=39493 RepID=A0A6I1MH60_9CLOT|nr:SPOR domain-containing protein [Clostridium tarantellae]MPQ42500.1 SPOR domain-containing protein [Clostridium tarantellae]
MKYTRYDLNNKKRKNERKKMIFSIIGVFVLAIVIATVAAKPLFENSQNKDNNISADSMKKEESTGNANKSESNGEQGESKPTAGNDNSDTKVIPKGEGETFVMVQCGYYAKKENADSIKSKLNDKVIAVNVPEGDKFRVIAYIGSEENSNKLAEELTAAQISNTKSRFFIPKTDTCNAEIIEIINGYLKILDKLKEKDVKGVKTQEFKDWVNKLEEKKDEKNFNIFKELKDGINALPEEINKQNIEEGYQVVFKVINYFKI